MIKTKSNTYNQINSIIKDYIENDRFANIAEISSIKKELFNALITLKPILLLVLLNENKLQLISPDDINYYKEHSIGNNFLSLGEYSSDKLKSDICKFSNTRDFINNEDIVIVPLFIKSDLFKNRLLDIFHSYNIEKLNHNSEDISDLFNLKISLEEATIQQKIFSYYKIYNKKYNNEDAEVLKNAIKKDLSIMNDVEKIKVKKYILEYYYLPAVIDPSIKGNAFNFLDTILSNLK